jgi:hypothetical protein
MLIIGCDYHPGFQQIACVDTGFARKFCRLLFNANVLAQLVRIGLVMGYMLDPPNSFDIVDANLQMIESGLI